MKVLSILVAASLALTPAIASAGSDGDSTDDGRPISGPLAGRVLPYSAVPVGAIVLGSLILIGGAVVALIGDDDPNNKTDSTNGTVK